MVWQTVMLWWLVICTKKAIQDKDAQIGKHLEVSIAAFVNQGILHLILPAASGQQGTTKIYDS
jgi:hypothetical protein